MSDKPSAAWYLTPIFLGIILVMSASLAINHPSFGYGGGGGGGGGWNTMDPRVCGDKLCSEIPGGRDAFEAGTVPAEESTTSIIIPSGSSAQGCKKTNSCFIPYSISVNTGQTVTWTNKDTYAHTVTSGYADKGPDYNFDGNLFMTGATFSWTAKTAGEYPYFCVIHPWMAGIVIVKGTSSSGIIDTINSPDVLIPSWIKDVAGFWCGDEIDNASFIEAIQFLINNDVIIVPATASSGSGTQEIPNWIKSNACWWSQNLISDEDFAGGLQYLIKEGIIRI